MAASNEGYWSRSLGLLTRDEGWFKPLLVLAAARLVPVVGPFGADGYGLEWARLTAWGVDSSPKQKNVDISACIKTGARAFVVALGYGVALVLIRLALSVILGEALGGLLGIALMVAASVLVVVAKLRSAIYQTIGAGYQVNRIADMVKRDANGLLRIAGITVLTGMAVGMMASMLFGGIMMVHMGGMLRDLVQYEYYGYVDEWYVVSSVLDAFGSALPSLMVMTYVVGIAISFVRLIQATAIGLWMRQFDVRNWGESSDPLPTTPASGDRPRTTTTDTTGGYGTSGYGTSGYATTPHGSTSAAAPTEDQVAYSPIPTPVADDIPQPVGNEAPAAAQTNVSAEGDFAGQAAEPYQAASLEVPEPASEGGEDMQAPADTMQPSSEQAEFENADRVPVVEPIRATADEKADEVFRPGESSEVWTFPLMGESATTESDVPATPTPIDEGVSTNNDVPVTPSLRGGLDAIDEAFARAEAAIQEADMSADEEGDTDKVAAIEGIARDLFSSLGLATSDDEDVREASSDETIVEVVDLTGGSDDTDANQDEAHQ